MMDLKEASDKKNKQKHSKKQQHKVPSSLPVHIGRPMHVFRRGVKRYQYIVHYCFILTKVQAKIPRKCNSHEAQLPEAPIDREMRKKQ